MPNNASKAAAATAASKGSVELRGGARCLQPHLPQASAKGRIVFLGAEKFAAAMTVVTEEVLTAETDSGTYACDSAVVLLDTFVGCSCRSSQCRHLPGKQRFDDILPCYRRRRAVRTEPDQRQRLPCDPGRTLSPCGPPPKWWPARTIEQ